MSNMSETSLDLCGKAKCCPPERTTVKDYTQHISISDKQRTPATFAATCGVTVRKVTERKRSPIDCTGAYHLSRGTSRLNAPELVVSLSPERRRSRSFEHVGHLTASHGVWRKGGAGRDASRAPHTALRPARLSGGARPGAGPGRPGDAQLRPAGRRRRQGARHRPALCANTSLTARRRQGQGCLADDLRWRLERSRRRPRRGDRRFRGPR